MDKVSIAWAVLIGLSAFVFFYYAYSEVRGGKPLKKVVLDIVGLIVIAIILGILDALSPVPFR